MERIIGNIPGVGIETARNLLKHFGSVRALVNADEKDYKEVPNVGPKRAKLIFGILNSGYKKD
jgi:ERCC4-type nuclease